MFENAIKVVLAVLLFLCLANMPYGYYQLVRFLAFLGFSILAYKSYERHEHVVAIVFGSLALLFQPFLKVALGRELWNIVDVVVGSGLILSIFLRKGWQTSE